MGNHPNVVEYLVKDCKIDVHNEINDMGMTPAFSACWKGSLDVVKHLVNKWNADVLTVTDNTGKTPLQACVHTDIIDYLRSIKN